MFTVVIVILHVLMFIIGVRLIGKQDKGKDVSGDQIILAVLVVFISLLYLVHFCSSGL